MCEYCGCQAIGSIETLTREHDEALDHIRAIRRALAASDDLDVRSSCARLVALLGPHTAVEERALFPALLEDFPEQIAALHRDHRVVEAALAEATADGPRTIGWEHRLEEALCLLRKHILQEQDGVFPAALSTLTPAQWDRLGQVRTSATSAQEAPRTIPTVGDSDMEPTSLLALADE